MSDGEKRVFPYIPNSVPEVKSEMLRQVGAHDEMELYVEIPERLRFKRKLKGDISRTLEQDDGVMTFFC